MNRFGKMAFGAALLAATGFAVTAPAEAGVAVRIGVPVPAVAPPCAYTLARCGYYSYSTPVYVGGRWWHGPHYYRYWHGRHWVWWHGGWHAGFRGGWHGHRAWHGRHHWRR